MSDPTDPLAWVERAEEDYAIASASLRRKKAWTYGACFHAQQCAEKYLKAALVARGQVFPKVHDFINLEYPVRTSQHYHRACTDPPGYVVRLCRADSLSRR